MHPLRERPPPEAPIGTDYISDLSLFLDADMLITQIQSFNYLKFWICYGQKIQNALEELDPDGSGTINPFNNWSNMKEVESFVLERVLPVAKDINKNIVNLKNQGIPKLFFFFLKS